MRYAFIFLAAASLFAQAPVDVVISQVYGGGGNSGAPYRNDYIELLNRSKSPVNVGGWSVQYSSASGSAWQVTPLTGTIQPGRYYLVQQSAGANDAAPALPQPDATGTIAMSATAGQVALVRSPASINNVSEAADYFAYSNLSNTTAALRRNNGCTDTNNASDFQTGAPNPRSSQFETVVDCDAPQQPPTQATISQIQGAGERSPLEGRSVTTRGVVTGRKSNGFWIQSLPSDVDTDPVTSEGLWVFMPISPPGTVDRGYVVEVTGTVTEFRPASDQASPPLTELVDAQVVVNSQGQALPAPVSLPATGDWERYEGMRVSIPEVRAAGPTLGSVSGSTASATSNGIFYAVLPGQPRPYRSNDPNERIQRLRVDTRAQGGSALDISSGTMVRNVVGPLDFSFRTYTVAQDAQEMLSATGGVTAGPVPAPGAREFTAATMNLQQFYDETDDAGGDVVLNAGVLQRRVDRAGRLIREYLQSPDIIGVQEAENETVLRAIARAAGDYDAHLLEGDDPSNIDVGLLVKRGRVVVQSTVQEGKGERIPSSNDLLWDRPPLAAKVTVEGVSVTVIVVHMRSLIDAETATVAAKRQAQAQALGRIVRTRIAAGEQVLLMGDFNTYHSDPLMAEIRGDALLNLSDTLSPSENYSYVFDGETQSIDHILISQGLRSRLVRYAVTRVNADFPEVARNDANRVERTADHDIPVAYLSLAPESIQLAPAAIVNGATFLGGAIAPLEIITLFGRGLGPETLVSFEATGLGPSLAGTRVLFDGVPADIIYTSSGQVSVVVPPQVASRGTTSVQVEYQGTRTPEVLMQVAAAAPGIFTLTRTGFGQGAILNQDYSVNGPSAPAQPGSVVMLFGTGGGVLQPTAGDVPARLVQPVTVRIGGRPAEVSYAGQAPGLINGVIQINAQIPADLPAGDAIPVVVTVGDRVSAFHVTLAVR